MVTAVCTVVTHQGVRHTLYLVSAREVGTRRGHLGSARFTLLLVSGEAAAFQVTGQKVAGHVLKRTFCHRLHGPVGRRGEDELACGVGGCVGLSLKVGLAYIGCCHSLVTRYDAQFFSFSPCEGGAMRRLGTGEGKVKV